MLFVLYASVYSHQPYQSCPPTPTHPSQAPEPDANQALYASSPSSFASQAPYTPSHHGSHPQQPLDLSLPPPLPPYCPVLPFCPEQYNAPYPSIHNEFLYTILGQTMRDLCELVRQNCYLWTLWEQSTHEKTALLIQNQVLLASLQNNPTRTAENPMQRNETETYADNEQKIATLEVEKQDMQSKLETIQLQYERKAQEIEELMALKLEKSKLEEKIQAEKEEELSALQGKLKEEKQTELDALRRKLEAEHKGELDALQRKFEAQKQQIKDAHRKTKKQLQDKNTSQTTELEAQRTQSNAQEVQLMQQNSQIAGQEAQIMMQEKEITKKNIAITEKDAEIAELKRQLKEALSQKRLPEVPLGSFVIPSPPIVKTLSSRQGRGSMATCEGSSNIPAEFQKEFRPNESEMTQTPVFITTDEPTNVSHATPETDAPTDMVLEADGSLESIMTSTTPVAAPNDVL